MHLPMMMSNTTVPAPYGDLEEFGKRWRRAHPQDNYLPPFLGGPVDEMFLSGQNLYMHGYPMIDKLKSIWPEEVDEELEFNSTWLNPSKPGTILHYLALEEKAKLERQLSPSPHHMFIHLSNSVYSTK